jgi:hypothetical protein
VWLWVLAFLGLKSLWSWPNRRHDAAWEERKRRFRSKLDEAFSVWREDESQSDAEDTSGE